MYDPELGKDYDFNEIDPADAEAAVARFQDECRLADAAVADVSFDATVEVRGDTMSLRLIYIHMIDEYARHNGHADLLREAIDERHRPLIRGRHPPAKTYTESQEGAVMTVTRPKSFVLLAVAVGALVVGLALPTAAAQAAHLINGRSIKNHTITGKKLKNNTLTGTQIKESTLRTVPKASRVAAGAISSSSIAAGGLSLASLRPGTRPSASSAARPSPPTAAPSSTAR